MVFNKDSCRVGPEDWVRLAKILHQQRNNFSAFIVVHGTDTMAYTASALSLMVSLAGFSQSQSKRVGREYAGVYGLRRIPHYVKSEERGSRLCEVITSGVSGGRVECVRSLAGWCCKELQRLACNLVSGSKAFPTFV